MQTYDQFGLHQKAAKIKGLENRICDHCTIPFSEQNMFSNYVCALLTLLSHHLKSSDHIHYKLNQYVLLNSWIE